MNSVSIDPSGSPGYRAVLEGAGLIDLSERGKLLVTGPDRVSFLHAMISNDVEKLAVGSGRHGTFLTATGKLVADFHYYKLEDSLLIDLDAGLAEPLKSGLEKFIIMDDVTVQDVGDDWGHLSLQGPLSQVIAGDILDAEVPDEPYGTAPVRFAGREGRLIRKSPLSPLGCEIVLAAAAASTLKSELLRRPEVVEVGEAARETLRVENGIPRFGVDMDSRNNPLEARLDDAISFTKGCYIGQEVVAKATYIGGVGRLLMRLKLDGETVPERGAPVLDGSGKTVGAVTSAVYSPRLRRPIALALLRRTAAQTGSRVSVDIGGGTAPAEVVEEFLFE